MADSADDIQIFLDAFRRLVQALRVAERAAQGTAGISAAQLFVLRCLAAAREPLDLRTLAARTHTHHSSVSVVVQRLVEQRLVARRRAAGDARRAEVRLTGSGERLLRRAPRSPQQRLIAYLQGLPPARRRRLAREQVALAAAVAPAGGAAPMLFTDRSARRRGGG
jgi:DNA-binding MarR family transcriptional regulator